LKLELSINPICINLSVKSIDKFKNVSIGVV